MSWCLRLKAQKGLIVFLKLCNSQDSRKAVKALCLAVYDYFYEEDRQAPELRRYSPQLQKLFIKSGEEYLIINSEFVHTRKLIRYFEKFGDEGFIENQAAWFWHFYNH